MSRWLRASQSLAAIAVGMAIGIGLFPVITGPRVQQLRLERDQAIARVEGLEKEVAAERNRPAPCEVRRVRAEMEGTDQRVALEAGRRLQREMAELIGRPVESLSFVVLYGRYHGRLMEIDGLLYQLEVRALAIGPELTLYGHLQPVAQ